MLTTDKNNPNVDQIEKLLQSIRPFPGNRFHQIMAQTPWKGIQQRKEAVFHMNTHRRYTAISIIALIIIASLMITPAGSAFASDIVQFFTRALSNTLPLPSDQIVPPVPSVTPEPTHALSLKPADQIVQTTPTTKPTLELNPAELKDMSIKEAETAVGFDLFEPVSLPGDYRLTRILFDSIHQAVSMWYASPQAGSGEFFQVTQGKSLEPFSVGKDASVESVTIGKHEAEFVQGGWFTYDGASESTWENEAGIYTLRWQEAEITFSIMFFMNDSFYPAYLDRDQMLSVAGNLVVCDPPGDEACRMKQAAAAAGFIPVKFAAPPEGIPFRNIDYRPGQITLSYGNDAEKKISIQQSVQDFSAPKKENWNSIPEKMIQSVLISGLPGEFIQGGWLSRPGESKSVWNPDLPLERLRWRKDGIWFLMERTGKPALKAPQLVNLAEKLTDNAGQTVTPLPQKMSSENTPAEAFTSVADVETAAGYDILEPNFLPEGLSFSHARLIPSSNTVMLFYGTFAADKIHVNGPSIILNQTPRTQGEYSFNESYPPEAIQTITVNGYPGKLTSGMLMTRQSESGQPTPTPTWNSISGDLALSWQTETMLYSIQFNPAGKAARLSSQDLVKIAESLH